MDGYLRTLIKVWTVAFCSYWSFKVFANPEDINLHVVGIITVIGGIVVSLIKLRE